MQKTIACIACSLAILVTTGCSVRIGHGYDQKISTAGTSYRAVSPSGVTYITGGNSTIRNLEGIPEQMKTFCDHKENKGQTMTIQDTDTKTTHKLTCKW